MSKCHIVGNHMQLLNYEIWGKNAFNWNHASQLDKDKEVGWGFGTLFLILRIIY